ncbi:hypothetical protein K438DRAFT_1785318 [Mycena galopus ATCC 62051]|nr:hypothetical protein K438DRAFT_1785318 [Mycena galopus ATCC 62051]
MQTRALSELLSCLLAFVAIIPNHTFRYTALGFLLVLAILCSVNLRSPSMQMGGLGILIDQTEEHIRRAMVQNPRRSAKTASLIKSRMLSSEAGWFSWNQYWSLSNDIGECIKGVKEIRTAIQLTLEAEHQRRVSDDIVEMRISLVVCMLFTQAIEPVNQIRQHEAALASEHCTMSAV